jgi:hypothetical protein
MLSRVSSWSDTPPRSFPAIDPLRRRNVREVPGGALPFTFPAISVHESFAYPSSLVLRNLLAMDATHVLDADRGCDLDFLVPGGKR